jgi:CheY-like chemotaxis protein
MMEKKSASVGLLLTDDLIFSSRVTGTARALGLEMKTAKSIEALNALAQELVPACIILDLGHPRLQIDELIKDLRRSISPRIVAYGSHIDAATLRTARDAGCDPVLPRSKFVEDLPRLLPEWMKASVERETGRLGDQAR